MKLARRERLALITLLSALVALCVDKILLPEPASTIAEVTYTAEQDLMKVTLPPEPATLLSEAPQHAAERRGAMNGDPSACRPSRRRRRP